VTRFHEEVEAIKIAVERKIGDLRSVLSVRLTASRDNNALLISRGVAGLRVTYETGYMGNLDDWRLRIDITKGSPPSSRGFPFQEPPPPLLTIKFEPVGADSFGFRWFEIGARDPMPQSSEQVAETAVRLLLEYIDKLARDEKRF
jgi:hypothetical protein